MPNLIQARNGDALVIDGAVHMIRKTSAGHIELVPIADEQEHYALTPEGQAALRAAAA